MLYERGLPSSRLVPQLHGISLDQERQVGAPLPAGLMLAHGLCSTRGSGVKKLRPLTCSFPADVPLHQHPCTSPEEQFPSCAGFLREELGFFSVGTHPEEAPAAAMLWLTQVSHSSRTAWGLKAKGLSHQLRA